MHKFELYARRNIFSPAEDGSRSSQSQHPVGAPSTELESLRSRYAELTARNNFLREEAAGSESLLNQMNRSIFDLRVGAQVLDACEVKPLADTVSGMTQWHQDLVELCMRARCECTLTDIVSCDVLI